MSKIISLEKRKQKPARMCHKKVEWGKHLFRFVVLLFLATSAYVLFYAPFLDIINVKISGLERISDAQLRSDIEISLSGKDRGGISRRNFILADTKKLGTELLDKYKRIETISVEKEFPDTLVVAIKERKLLMILCSGEQCHTLNEELNAYPAENFTPEELKNENIITLRDLGGTAAIAGTQPLEEDYVQFVLAVRESVLKETGIGLTMDYETPNRMSGDLRVQTDAGWKIYLSKDSGLDKEIFMLKTVLNQKIDEDIRKDLEYIDLRIKDKVFYKFREGTQSKNEALQEEMQITDEKPDDDSAEKDKKKKK